MEKYLKYEDVIHAVLHNEGQAAVAAIQNIKPVDVSPVTHAHWKRVNPYSTCETYLCSNCNYYTYIYLTKYCPDCGALMDGV